MFQKRDQNKSTLSDEVIVAMVSLALAGIIVFVFLMMKPAAYSAESRMGVIPFDTMRVDRAHN